MPVGGIKEKIIARNQLRVNIVAADALTKSYQDFIDPSKRNLLGGDVLAASENGGDNAKLILDALPSKYDAPALAASLSKILNDKNYKIENIKVEDKEVEEQANASSPNPVAVKMPFSMGVKGSYASLQNLVANMERSIRPFQIQTLKFSGDDSSLKIDITAVTFYQPVKNLNITTKEIKQ